MNQYNSITASQPRYLFVDGHNLLFQMFYGIPAKIPGKDGRDARAAIGFVGALLNLINLTRPTHIAVIFDSETSCNIRGGILDDYKANRPSFDGIPEDEIPFTYLPDVYSALDYMGIKHAEASWCECDDVIASYAKALADAEIYISSYDSDYFQLINKNTRVVRYRKDKSTICDEEYINLKFGIPPALYAESKAIFGDTSDNISGLRGVGPKTAAKLLLKYGGIDALISRPEMIEEEKLRRLIEDNRETLERNLALIKLTHSAPLPFSPEELEYTAKSERTMDIVRAVGVM